jgi:hypothetical protein
MMLRVWYSCRLPVLLCCTIAAAASNSHLRSLAAEPSGASSPTLATSPATHESATDQKPWYGRSLVGMEIGPTGAQFGHSDASDGRYCAHWDGRELVRRTIDTHGQYLVLWVRDGDYAYYDSKILPKPLGLADRDPLRDAVEEAKKHNLPVISYCVVQQGGHFLEAHPEWKMRDKDGGVIGRFCFNSGYLDAMKQIVAEQLAYGIDGFHIDMLDQGFGKPYGCWCDSCQRLFRQKYGQAMPRDVTWDEAWDRMLEFRYDTSQRFERELTAFIRSQNPRATVDYNYHGNPPFSFEVGQRPVQHAGNGDFVTGETGVWGFSALGVGLNAEFYRAATPGLPYQVAMQRGVRMYHDQTTRPLHDMRYEMMTLLAHGAFVTMIDKTGFDGWLDPVAYERMGKVLKEARDKADHFGHVPVQDIGIYFSSRSRDWVGREKPGEYFLSFQGVHRACAMEHWTFGVILDENATRETLAKHPIVVLPGAAIIAPAEAALLERYVREGGNLLITGHTGQYDRWGVATKTGSLATLIGAEPVEQLPSLDNWIVLPADAQAWQRTVRGDLRADWPFLLKGPATIYRPTTAAVYGQLHKPFRTLRQQRGEEGTEWPMSADSAVGPAVLLNRIGQGQVLTIAASPDYATASEHAIVESRTLLDNAFRLLHPAPRVRIAAPANVEAVVTDDADHRTLRIHLIAYHPTPRATPASNRPFVLPGLIQDEPIYRVRVTLADPPTSVTALDPRTQLQSTHNQVEATIENIHEVLLIRY